MSDAPDNVIVLDCVTSLDIPAERVLSAALKQGMQSVVICGYDSDGLEYFASSIAGGPEANWLLDRCKIKLMNGMDE